MHIKSTSLILYLLALDALPMLHPLQLLLMEIILQASQDVSYMYLKIYTGIVIFTNIYTLFLFLFIHCANTFPALNAYVKWVSTDGR